VRHLVDPGTAGLRANARMVFFILGGIPYTGSVSSVTPANILFPSSGCRNTQ